MNYREYLLMLLSVLPISTNCLEHAKVAKLKDMCVAKLRSKEFAILMNKAPHTSALLDTLPQIIFNDPTLLTGQLGYCQVLNTQHVDHDRIAYWRSSPFRFIFDPLYSPSRLDPHVAASSIYPPLSYLKQVYCTPSAIYLVTKRGRADNYHPMDIDSKDDYSFMIHRLSPQDFARDLNCRFPSQFGQSRWMRIPDLNNDIRCISLLPPVDNQEHPRILIHYDEEPYTIHDPNTGTVSDFFIPAYCRVFGNIRCITDDCLTGVRVDYDQITKQFLLINELKKQTLPIDQATHMFFFDNAHYLYVQESSSKAYCIDLASNSRVAEIRNAHLCEITTTHALQLTQSSGEHRNDTFALYDLLYYKRKTISNSELILGLLYATDKMTLDSVRPLLSQHDKKNARKCPQVSCTIM